MKTTLISAFTSLVTFLVIPAYSCEKKPCVSTQAEVTVPVDWSHCREKPGGMTVLIYSDAGVLVQDRVTPDVSQATFRLQPGTYRAAVFPYSREEWRSLTVSGLQDLDAVTVSPTAAEPSPFAAASGAPFTVPAGAERMRIPPLVPEDKVQLLLIRVVVDGLPMLGRMSGGLSPARPIHPFGERFPLTEQEATVPLPDGAWGRDSIAFCRRGWLGPPDSLRIIRLRMARKDGSVAVDTAIDIRGRISPEGVLTLGDRDGERFRIRGGSGGFEADIEGWAPGEQTEITLHTATQAYHNLIQTF